MEQIFAKKQRYKLKPGDGRDEKEAKMNRNVTSLASTPVMGMDDEDYSGFQNIININESRTEPNRGGGSS